jgi:hypothetical protein
LVAGTDARRAAAIARRLLLFLVVAAAGWTLVVAFSGGLDLRPYGISFRSTEADRPAYATLVLALVYVAAFRRYVPRHVAWLEGRAAPAASFLERRAAPAAFLAAAVTFALGMAYGIHVAGGSDSYGYISEARLWLSGDLVIEQPIAAAVPWPEGDWTFAPLAYRPAPERPGAIVPVYAPGLPVLMAIGTLVIGRCGPYIIVPLLAAWLVWMTFRLGTLIRSPLTGLASALLLVTSPIFLFMTLNPMSDVPAAAFFGAGLAVALSPWRQRAFWTGAVVGLGIFVRPNLAPIGAVHLGFLLLQASPGERARTFGFYAAGGVLPVLAVAATNTWLYGAPWRAGYGSLAEMYAWGYWWRNVQQFTAWMVRSETVWVPLGVVALAMCWRSERDRRLPMLFLAVVAATVWLSYLFYTPFDVWLYLRFLLPAFPALFVLAAAGAAALLTRVVGPSRAAAIGLLLAIPLFAGRIAHLRAEGILGSRIGGVAFLSAAEYVRTRLPENAVIVTVLHSGSIRHYTNRLTMRWDLLGPEWWPRAVDVLVERGYRPYLLVSSYEEAQLRQHFGLSSEIDAPGTLVAEMSAPEPFRIYDPLRQVSAAPDTIPAITVCPCGREGAVDDSR